MKPAGWILLALLLVAGFTALIMAYGSVGVLGAVLGVMAFFFGLDRLYRWKSKRLARSISPGETVVASGLVSEGTFDETAAVVVRDAGGHYRLLVADSRGAVAVQSVTPRLAGHPNVYDGKSYIEMQTVHGPMHFAPRKRFLVAGQYDCAQEILEAMLASISPQTAHLNGA